MAWSAQHARAPQSAAFTHPDGARSCCQTLTDEVAGVYGLAHGHGQGPAAEVAAIAALRACSRARPGPAGFDGASVRALVELAAAEVYQLRCSQRAYAGMSTSLALLVAGAGKVELALVGDCVAYILDRAGDRWMPVLCGAPAWLGPVAQVEPALSTIRRRPGLELLLASGQTLPILAASPSPAPTPQAIAEHSVRADERRGFGLVCVDLS